MRDTLVPRSEHEQEPPFVSPIIVLVTLPFPKARHVSSLRSLNLSSHPPPHITFAPFDPNNQSVQSRTVENMTVSFVSFPRSELGDAIEEEPKSAVTTLHRSEAV